MRYEGIDLLHIKMQRFNMDLGKRNMRKAMSAAMIFGALAYSPYAKAQMTPFAAGLADRTAYENWFSSISSRSQEGVVYWAAQRSLTHPGDCAQFARDAADPALASCREARRRLGPTDVRRKSEPDYRLGWNSFQETPPASVPAPTSLAPVASLAPPPPRRVTPTELELEAMAADCSTQPFPIGTNEYRAELSRALACQSKRNEARQSIAQRQQNADEVAAQRAREADSRAREAEARAAEARTQADQQRQEAEAKVAEAAAQAAQQQREADARAAEQSRRDQESASAARELSLEQSPDNKCADHKMAKEILTDMSAFPSFAKSGVDFIDIEHLRTVSSTKPHVIITCHGIFVTDTGQRLSGTFAIRENVAGDPIHSWLPDE